jgi:hypothetical protein
MILLAALGIGAANLNLKLESEPLSRFALAAAAC